MQLKEKVDLILVNALTDLETSGTNRGFQLGLVYIATYLKCNNFNSKIISGINVVLKILECLELQNGNECLVGFYVTADNVQEVERACIALKNLNLNIKIILGGPEARVDFKRLLTSLCCEYVCAGDGEECSLQLLNYLQKKADVRICDIPNLIFIDNITNSIVKNPAINLSFNLDTYPIPDRSLYDSRFLDIGHIATSRGCISECTFCFEGIDKKIRRHSTDRVIEEMRYLKNKYGTKYFSFVDDTFTTDRNKIYNLCEQIHTVFTPYKDIAWYCEAKVSDICKDPKIVQAMVNAGLIRMQFGAESGNQKVLNSYKKEILVEDLYSAVEIASKTKIASMFTNYIIGGAHETNESYKDTLKVALDLMRLAPGVLECSYTFLSPYKGTDVRNNPDKYEILILDNDFVTAHSDSYIFAHSKHLDRFRVLEMGQEFHYLVGECMRSQVPSLSMEKIKNHFLFVTFGMTSTWYNFLNTDPFLRKWGSYIQLGYETVATTDYTCLAQLIPCRTFELEKLQNDSLVWDFRAKQFHFQEMELFLVEMASGKLTLYEIIERVLLKYNFYEIGKQKVQRDIVSFYNNLADEFLITFRRFS